MGTLHRSMLFGGAMFAAGVAHAQSLDMFFYSLDFDVTGTDGYSSGTVISGSDAFVAYGVTAPGADAYAWGSPSLVGLGVDSDVGASADAVGNLVFTASQNMKVRLRWNFRGGLANNAGSVTFARATPYLALRTVAPSLGDPVAGFADFQLLGGFRYSIVSLTRSLADSDQASFVEVFPFDGAACPADLDGNGTLNFDDIDLFIGGFLGGDLTADLDGNGTLNFDDIDLFVASFLNGCP